MSVACIVFFICQTQEILQLFGAEKVPKIPKHKNAKIRNTLLRKIKSLTVLHGYA